MTVQPDRTSTELSVKEYGDRVASASPTPGGGSVSGITGALAAGLAGMVCALTLNGTTTDEQSAALRSSQRTASELRNHLLHLVVADEEAYGAYRTAAALPKSTDGERLHRAAAVQTALTQAAEAPLSIARACFDMLAILPAIVTHGTKHALSDANASAYLAFAALQSALLNVRVNAAMIKNADLAAHLLAESDRLALEGLALRNQTLHMLVPVE